MKYIARQINPEYQSSPMWTFFDESNYDGLFILADRGCKGINEDVYNEFVEQLEAVQTEIENGFGEYSWQYENFTECLKFELYNGLEKDNYNVEEWEKLFENFDADSYDDVCRALSLIDGNEWDYQSIHGCVQREWAYVIYNTSLWDENAINKIEIEYFNLGTEWAVSFDGIEIDENEIDNDFDIADSVDDWCTMYVYNWSDDGQRAEIADAIGCKAEDVIMFEYAGSYSTPIYSKVNF